MPQEEQIHYNKTYLENEVADLARRHQWTLQAAPSKPVAPLLKHSRETLTEAYRTLALAAKEKKELSTAAEWLIDNFYIIQEQFVQLKEDLPPSYYKKLPRLTEGEFKGLPRIYELVDILSAISDNVIDQENATTAVQAYQQQQTLKIGELWGVPIMIRLVLLVKLTRKVEQLLEYRSMRVKIDNRLNEILQQDTNEPGFLLRKLTDITYKKEDDKQFLCILAQRMQAQGLLTETERKWFDYKFDYSNTTLEDELRDEARRTSRLHLSIQNAIASLRDVSECDWSDFVENCSIVERILRLDPAGFYPNMDFQSRDRYRKVVERLAAHSSSHSEMEVAQKALLYAEQAQSKDTNKHVKVTHIGYYLTDAGYGEFVGAVDYRMPLAERLRRWAERHSSVYFLTIFIQLIIFLAIAGYATGLMSMQTWVVAATLGVAFFPALELAVVSTNRMLSLLLSPRILPKLKITGDLRDEFRTLVVVPTLFTSPDDVRSQFEDLEIRALANPNKSLQFVLLSDFTDADREAMPDDEQIIQTATKEVKRLNRRYYSNYGDKFYLLHRKRCWNASQHKWMGWERKRGKLEELNHLLNNEGADSTFTTISGDFLSSVEKPRVKYVITLDADTQLPPGSALKMISTAAHPLNRAVVNESGDRVIEGYGIFQPRISITPKTADKTPFAKIFSGNVGIDPYTTAVSDIYQDLFGEAVFTGKGLYEVEVFDNVLGHHFPDNLILSHDLLESTYLRTALLTDIELFDDYPSTYLNYIKRNHRWIRGDWQILHWLKRKVPAKGGGKVANPINAISKWKIFDNLRRSLNPVFLLLFLLAGWFLLPGSALIWTCAALGVIAFPIYSSFSTEIFQRPMRVKWKLYLEKIRSNIKVNTEQAITTFLFMPHMAYMSLDAIGRTLWRIWISHEYLLQWTATSLTERNSNRSLKKYLRYMWINIAWGIAAITVVWIYNPTLLFVAAPIAVAWIAAPVPAYFLSRKKISKEGGINEEAALELRDYARRTWHYFEQYISEEHSWLPPDNFQEEPYIGAVKRTSPTNIGLALVATEAAFQFGYTSLSSLLKRLENMLDSMRTLEKFSGHFFNWYNTETKDVLDPRYISTVDSGNLAASLLVVKQALYQLREQQWPNPAFGEGLKDTCRVLQEVVKEIFEPLKNGKEPKQRLLSTIEILERNISLKHLNTLSSWSNTLDKLKPLAENIQQIDIHFLKEEMEQANFETLQDWIERPLRMINEQLEEIVKVRNSTSLPKSNNPNKALFRIKNLQHLQPFSQWLQKADELAALCDAMVQGMDFSILYFEDKDLFSIGYNLNRAALDQSTYDQLATEARLASYIAIAKGDVPPKHWFRLSRRLTSINHNEILLSWGGTMFEYLMPVLFMSRTKSTLLDNTYDNVVMWQQNYGESRGKPWGFSESGYGVLNLELHYQYRAFGAPGLGLRRGLAEDYIVSPYASMLALMIHPQNAINNLRELKREGAYGLHGFYEAVDYSSSNGSPEEPKTIVKMYMAHHQAMSLLALVNVLNKNSIQNLFHRDPMIRACEVLLQERVPRGIPIKEPRPIDVELEPGEEKMMDIAVDHAGQSMLNDSLPRTHILSNGQYTTVITHAGTGYSTCNNIQLTRWRADRVQDPYGFFFFVKDLESNEYWSMGDQPIVRKADRYDSWFHTGKVQTARVDQWIESFMEVCVSAEDNLELRKITLTNYSQKPRKLELTSYAEVVLNEAETDKAHTVFSNLFVQTEFIAEHHALLAKRRPRSEQEKAMWLVHTMASDDLEYLTQPIEYETDRGNFIGRGRSLKDPRALDSGHKMSGFAGNVPEPIVSMRRIIELEPGEKKSVTFGLGKAESRDQAIAMADQYDNPYATERVFELASIYGRVELEHIGLSGKRAHYFQKLAGAIIYGNEQFRAGQDIIKQNRRTQSGLWAYGISGDQPILLYQIKETGHLRTLDLLLKAHALWRLKGLDIDLVIINDHPVSYINELQDAINSKIQASTERQRMNQKGGIFLLRTDNLPKEDLILLKAVASVVIEGELPDFRFETTDEEQAEEKSPQFLPLRSSSTTHPEPEAPQLLFYNGYGGFTKKGDEYVIHINTNTETQHLEFPPAPWINVLANPEFGCITSENGSGYSWSQNCRENRLTPWSNDVVVDPPGDVIYVRDENLKRFWTPTPGPVGGAPHYEVRHGFGYSRYISTVADIFQVLTKWVPVDDPLKIIKLRLSNTGLASKNISVFRYLDWVLDVYRDKGARHIATEYDENRNAILARNFYNNEFAERVAFAGLFTEHASEYREATADRTQFIGRNNNHENPRGLKFKQSLNHRFGAGFDPCAAFQSDFVLKSGDSLEVYCLLGETSSTQDALDLIDKYRSSETLEQSFTKTKKYWRRKLNTIQVNTPSPEINIMMNGWLQYQNIVSRIWARTGFYQSGGAFGFRDQLQDSSAALYLDPKLTRSQILYHAAHQFPQGDVLHWWHPPTDRGTRTRITDDLLWLPYVTMFYLKRTGDTTILNETVDFITARQLEDDEHEAYLQPEKSNLKATLYEHCCRAIDRSLTKGDHGLPLMGAGDWNDGMNKVGEKGKGESVWLGFFLYKVLQEFIPTCKQFKDTKRVETYQSYFKDLKKHLNKEGWDGGWFRRAFYDDGTPLGSSTNDECKIDAIAQAWAVISKAAPDEKAKKALKAADQYLVSETDGIIRLLVPPFDKTPHNPGYIKGYNPGVRENGGQYTHAALWLIRAFAEMRESNRATQLMRMIMPVNHSRSKEQADQYRVEPYAVAADIYSEPPLQGMGGWTWYTGSAGWMYRVILESILGLQINNKKVSINPIIPKDWNNFELTLIDRITNTRHHIKVLHDSALPSGKIEGNIDGKPLKITGKATFFTLSTDGETHEINLRMGRTGTK